MEGFYDGYTASNQSNIWKRDWSTTPATITSILSPTSS